MTSSNPYKLPSEPTEADRSIEDKKGPGTENKLLSVAGWLLVIGLFFLLLLELLAILVRLLSALFS